MDLKILEFELLNSISKHCSQQPLVLGDTTNYYRFEQILLETNPILLINFLILMLSPRGIHDFKQKNR